MEFIQNHLTFISIVASIYAIFIILHFRQEKIVLKNPKTNKTETIHIQYSWSSVIFLFFVPLYRQDIDWFLVYFAVTFFTLGLGIFALAYSYNIIYIHRLMKLGYIAADRKSGELLFSKVLR